MNKKTIFFFLVLLIVTGCLQLFAQQLAFPGAEGYGKYASGGRGNGKNGKIAIVTNLEDDLENPPVGSIRWALKQGMQVIHDPILGDYTVPMPLTIVFRVGGVINLKGDLRSKRNNLTVAGQTAPGDGICFRGGTVNFGGSTNVIVRYIRSRPGDELGDEVSAFRIENGKNFIIDHCSFSWAIEETTHFSSSPNFTVQWCIISESFYNSFHKKGPRGYGSQHGGMYASYHHNLMAHHNSRTPRINGSNENDVEALVDYRNNVSYNWGRSGSFYGGEWMKTNGKGFAHTNVVNNYFIPGPGNYGTLYFAAPGTGDNGYAGWYFNGNVMVGEDAKTSDNWLGVDYDKKDSIRSDGEFVQSDGELEDFDNYTQNADDAYLSIVENVGATLPKRDAHDIRLIKEMTGEIGILRYEYTDSTGQKSPVKGIETGIIDTQINLVSPEDRAAGKTAWDVYRSTPETEAPVDNDHDGMPDVWETKNGLNPNDSLDFRLIANNGYSNLENYINGINFVVSTFETENRSIFKIYPNPGKANFKVISSVKIIQIDVYDLMGKKLESIHNSSGIESFSIQQLNSGIYLVKGKTTNNKISVQKLIIQ
jgi:hypothetical protein